MNLFNLIATSRRRRRHVVVAVSVAIAALAFGASFVAAQESRNFMPWFTQSSAGGTTGDDDTILRTSVGQTAMGRMVSDDFEVTLGFYTGVQAGAPAFAARVQELALTPLPTSTSTPVPTATLVPTEVPAEATATSQAVEDTPTPESPAVEDTPTMVASPTSTSVPPTQAPTATEIPVDAPTNTPIVIVVTTPPEPETEPVATATPFIIVVTAPPADTPTPTPPSSGGACGVPTNPGSGPLDLGMLMLLVAPLMLWRFGIKP